jgi:predicted nucleic acid binding AN1-type Zn finger protein
MTLQDTSVNQNNQETKKEDVKPKKIRCKVCRKKLGHIVFHCECNGVFCVSHQSAHMHDCPKLSQKQALRKQHIEMNNPKVIPTTLEVI